ncbi:DUF2254 domain-containing protein [Pseudonocardia asaccharolytica]|uniref:DUF2254 domain-containing protein n=1 Tax=Pseudonocardia asaccharolytica TaxID=54010 RepID=UPI0011BE34E4|nr:DUF2254 domain-containing protein [Pseudonocardia asaccharolytica]
MRRLVAAPQQRVHRDGHGRVLLPHTPTPPGLVALTFAEVRQATAALPDVCVYLLECLHEVRRALDPHPLDPATLDAIAEQARLVVDGAARSDLLPEDLARLRHAYSRHFPRGPP